MGVCLDKAHFRDWLLGQCVPPPALRKQQLDFACEMVQMGFPTRTKADIPTLVHATLVPVLSQYALLVSKTTISKELHASVSLKSVSRPYSESMPLPL